MSLMTGFLQLAGRNLTMYLQCGYFIHVCVKFKNCDLSTLSACAALTTDHAFIYLCNRSLNMKVGHVCGV